MSIVFQSTLPARGATGGNAPTGRVINISIHAPREGSDVAVRAFSNESARISIHAPREGSDGRTYFPHWRNRCNFNPRSPRGERPSVIDNAAVTVTFQSTLPARGATLIFVCKSTLTGNFNPRSPRGERLAKGVGHGHGVQFQSTLPARGATRESAARRDCKGISIHAPREGSDY